MGVGLVAAKAEKLANPIKAANKQAVNFSNGVSSRSAYTLIPNLAAGQAVLDNQDLDYVAYAISSTAITQGFVFMDWPENALFTLPTP